MNFIDQETSFYAKSVILPCPELFDGRKLFEPEIISEYGLDFLGYWSPIVWLASDVTVT